MEDKSARHTDLGAADSHSRNFAGKAQGGLARMRQQPEPSFVMAGPQTVLRASLPPDELQKMVSTLPMDEYLGRVYREAAVMPMLTGNGINKGVLNLEKMMPHINHPRQTGYRPADSVGEVVYSEDREPPKISGKIGSREAVFSGRKNGDQAESLIEQVNALGANWNQDPRGSHQRALGLYQLSQSARQPPLEPLADGGNSQASKAGDNVASNAVSFDGCRPSTESHQRQARNSFVRKKRSQQQKVGPPGLNKALQEAVAKRDTEAGPTSWCPGPPGSTAPVPSWMKRDQAIKDGKASPGGPLTLAGNFAMDSARGGGGPSGKEAIKGESVNEYLARRAASQGRPTGAGKKGEAGKEVEKSLGNNAIGKRLAQLGLQPIKPPPAAVKGK